MPRAHPENAIDLLKASKPVHLMDKFVIDQIREDMRKTILPGWINRAPHNFGSASHGKLSADHWRTLFTINLVITLVRLWGHSKASEKKIELLQNFMALVSVIRFATARTISEDQIQIVELQLQEYYRTLSKLTEKFYPSHHLSLHIPECLRRFGPVHGWWSYPYERYNGIMQRQNHNGKISKSVP